MFRNVAFLLRRRLRSKDLWLTLLALLFCSVFLVNRCNRSYVNYDLITANLALGVDFSTKAEFRAWFDLWQFQLLMSSGGQLWLFPVLLRLFPRVSSAEVRFPVSLGQRRSRVCLGAVAAFAVFSVLLSLGWMLLGAVLESLHFAQSALYYIRCIALRLWLDLGFAGLVLAVGLLPKNRVAGMLLSFGLLALLGVASSANVFYATPFACILSSGQTSLWLWQVQPAVPAAALAAVLLFPIVSFGLGYLAAFHRFHDDLI
jgi:hypothetical protein